MSEYTDPPPKNHRPIDDLPAEAIDALRLLKRFGGNIFFSPEDPIAAGCYALHAAGLAVLRRRGHGTYVLIGRVRGCRS